jgi:hypothetical protein
MANSVVPTNWTVSEVANLLPNLYETEEVPDKKALVKLFSPVGGGTWYLLEANEDGTAFGYVTGLQFDEYGNIDLNELYNCSLPFGLRIEKDVHFEPISIDEVKERGY